MDFNSKILVTGPRGLVGSAIIRKLSKDGYSNILTPSHADLELLDQKAVCDYFKNEKPEYVFLAAAKVGGILANNTYPAEFIYKNLMIQNNIIHQSYVHKVKKIIFLGSSCIYPKLCSQPMKEDYLMTGSLESTNSSYAVAKIAGIEMCWAYNRQYGTKFLPVMPTNLYGINDNFDLDSSHVLPALIRKLTGSLESTNSSYAVAKIAGIEMCWAYNKQYGTKFLPVMPTNLYGINDNFDLDTSHVLPALIRKFHEAKQGNRDSVTIWGSGNPKREFLHVDDLADACIFLINKNLDNHFYKDKPLLNIGTGKDLNILELAQLIKKITKFNGKIIFDRSKPDGTPRKLLDVSKMKPWAGTRILLWKMD